MADDSDEEDLWGGLDDDTDSKISVSSNLLELLGRPKAEGIVHKGDADEGRVTWVPPAHAGLSNSSVVTCKTQHWNKDEPNKDGTPVNPAAAAAGTPAKTVQLPTADAAASTAAAAPVKAPATTPPVTAQTAVATQPGPTPATPSVLGQAMGGDKVATLPIGGTTANAMPVPSTSGAAAAMPSGAATGAVATPPVSAATGPPATTLGVAPTPATTMASSAATSTFKLGSDGRIVW